MGLWTLDETRKKRFAYDVVADDNTDLVPFGDRLVPRLMQAECGAESAAISIATAATILIDTFAGLCGLTYNRAGSTANGCADGRTFPGAAG
ncbi:hypothetical protein RP75_24005 [Agrobacterium arsenijevicii]|uniref:Uncharacterized protein n=1 Tax=Agrobacterium arsenijevicii TaxID=1585697 RepID=A0ABR5D1G7_9HYPH|nr:hypothetical protein RP75_24005 [Agrobacterium arsenijevicii]